MGRSELLTQFTPRAGSPPVIWAVSDGLAAYELTVAAMERRVADIALGRAPECVWLLQHPPIYTAGTSSQDDDLGTDRFPVYRTGRGGQYTYHGPGQRVAYVMLDLKRRRSDVRAFVAALETWIIGTLGVFGVTGERREDRVGVWVARTGPDGSPRDDKIAALGIRLRHWVSYHGVSINIAPDLSHFEGIVPCGIRGVEFGITSLSDLGIPAGLHDVDVVLRQQFEPIFGATIEAAAP